MKRVFLAVVVCLLSVFAQWALADLQPSVVNLPTCGEVGGGWTDAGPMGEYFVGADFSGAPAFTRREVRIAFDWGTVLPVGGSTAQPYKSFPHDNFSVRYTGGLLPRFTEAYTFAVLADSNPKLSLKNTQTGETQNVEFLPVPLLASAPGDHPLASKPVALQAGVRYEAVLEYHHGVGRAQCALSWSSPSTPTEVIDPVVEQGLNLGSWEGFCWADRAKGGRWGKPETSQDENGQLKVSNGEYILREGGVLAPGTYLLSFTGYANVSLFGFRLKFVVDGKEYDQLTAKGPGYDAANNRTVAMMKADPESKVSISILRFKDAFRDAAGTQPGIADFHVMNPIATGADQPCPADAVTWPPMKRMASYFTCMRWLQIANFGGTPFWKDRTLPTFAKFTRGAGTAADPTGGENWEYLVMFANESGRDLYLCTPLNADDEYFRKLALLLRYGSDGVEPYTQPTANAKYPPLNPNLRCYFEVGNEIWNWAFQSTQQDMQFSKDVVEKNTAEGKIINYDGKGSGNYRRYHAVRSVKASNTFREVFGDAAMGSRIRPLMEYQYANAQETAWQSLNFLDRYYNNGDGQHVTDPHPVRYYLWGGGGAAYYGVGNGEGEQTDVAFKDQSFEDHVIADGEKSSDATAAWSFKGTAGIYRALSSAVASYTSGKVISQPKKTGIGIRFKTGEKPLWVYKLGRVFTSGDDKGVRLSLLHADSLDVVATAETGPVQAYMTKIFGYYWAELPDKKPIQLTPNTEYLLVSQDLGGQTRIAGPDTAIHAGAGLTGVKAINVAINDPKITTGWKVTDGAADCCAGPVTMLYSDRADVVVDLPQPPDGQQAAYLTGTGEISQTVNFPKAGAFALTINITTVGWVPFRLYCDDQNASPSGVADIRGNSDSFAIGGWGRNNGFKEEWGSAVFTIDKPGPHVIRLVGTQKPGGKPGTVVFDNLRIVSVDAIMDSGFGSGSALGQPLENSWGASQAKDSLFAWSFGLPRVSYETGWSLGGDFYQKPIQNWCKLCDPRAQKINDQAMQLFTKAGGFMPVFGVYTYWPVDDFAKGQDYPIMKSFIEASRKLPPMPDNGAAIPALLTAKDCVPWNGQKAMPKPGDWMSFAVVCPDTAVYTVTADTSAGGKIEMEADGVTLGAAVDSGQPATYRVRMTRGMHGIRIRNRGGSVELKTIAVDVSKP